VVDASTIATLRALIAERDAWLSRSTTGANPIMKIE
jgi:hypothetical protein